MNLIRFDADVKPNIVTVNGDPLPQRILRWSIRVGQLVDVLTAKPYRDLLVGNCDLRHNQSFPGRMCAGPDGPAGDGYYLVVTIRIVVIVNGILIRV